MLGPKLWLTAGLMSVALFIIAGCGGGQDGGGSGADSQAPGLPAQDTGGIGPPPHVFIGTVTIDGSPAPDGALVSAFIEGETGPVAQAEVSGGGYTLMVEQPSGGDFKGKTVTFTISGLDASPSVPWEFGGADEVNLSVSGGSGTGGGGAADLVSQGKDIFTGSGGCAACHTIDGVSAGMVGPDLTHIGAADFKGKTVTFTISGLDASPSVPWEFGGADEVNLSVSGGSGTGGGGAADLVSQGKDIFTGSGGCAACHTIDGVSAGMVGPDLTHIGAQGGSRKPGLSAREYITESIKDPEAFVATGVDRAIPGIMTQGITAGLSDGEVDALVAFLLAQK